jgi:hypothetical protein
MDPDEAAVFADLQESQRADSADEARKQTILAQWAAQQTRLGVFTTGGRITYEGHDSGGLRFMLRASRTSPAFLQIQLNATEARAWAVVMIDAANSHDALD